MSRGRSAGTVVKCRPPTDARAKAWTSMRVLVLFDPVQLAITAEAEVANVLVYIKRLRRAGYLRLAQKNSAPQRRRARYQLIRDTGPKAPIARKGHDVYDQNTGTLYRVQLLRGDYAWFEVKGEGQ
jgi:hypothetical protein